MSGFEIAGVVLGAFPLVTTALEDYRAVARVVGLWWQIRQEYEKCAGEVRYHHLRYKRNLEQLLLPLVVEDDTIRGLLAQPGADLWRDPGIAQQLEIRLQGSYELYLEIMQQMARIIENLDEELGVHKANLQEKLSRPKVSIPLPLEA